MSHLSWTQSYNVYEKLISKINSIDQVTLSCWWVQPNKIMGQSSNVSNEKGTAGLGWMMFLLYNTTKKLGVL